MSASTLNRLNSTSIPAQTLTFYTSDELIVDLSPLFRLTLLSSFSSLSIGIALFQGTISTSPVPIPVLDAVNGNDFANGIVFAVIDGSFLDALNRGSYSMYCVVTIDGLSKTLKLPLNIVLKELIY
jgi:hypothetical protein